MWIVEIDTRSYTFLACGDTRAQALLAVEDGWRRHAKEHNATPGTHGFLTMEEFLEEAHPLEIRSGECFRDGEALEDVANFEEKA